MLCERKAMILICCVALLLSGCSGQQLSEDKKKNVSYTVVEDAEIPETLKNAIEEKKESPFKLSYSDKDELYIVIGYGKQSTGGYSIVVDDLYMTDTNMVFATTLKGSDEKVETEETVSYPYLVVKTEYIDCEIVYE